MKDDSDNAGEVAMRQCMLQTAGQPLGLACLQEDYLAARSQLTLRTPVQASEELRNGELYATPVEFESKAQLAYKAGSIIIDEADVSVPYVHDRLAQGLEEAAMPSYS